MASKESVGVVEPVAGSQTRWAWVLSACIVVGCVVLFASSLSQASSGTLDKLAVMAVLVFAIASAIHAATAHGAALSASPDRCVYFTMSAGLLILFASAVLPCGHETDGVLALAAALAAVYYVKCVIDFTRC